jgi:Integrase core domain
MSGHEMLRVPQKYQKSSRLWLSDGSQFRLRRQHPNHVWSFEFVEASNHDGRRLHLMTLIDEFSRKCLAVRVARRINAIGVIETAADAKLLKGLPAFIRSDNCQDMVAKVLCQWLPGLGMKSLYIAPGSIQRMASASSSMENSAMNASMVRYSTPSEISFETCFYNRKSTTNLFSRSFPTSSFLSLCACATFTPPLSFRYQ